MKRSVILFAGLGIWQASVAKGQVQTPEQLAGGVVGGQIYTSADAQEYYMGTVSSGQTVTGNIVGGVYPNQPSLSWYKYISDGVTPVTFDMYGTQMAYGYNGFGASNDGELAVFDSQGNFVAENKGSSIPSTGDSNVPAVIPAGAPNPPVSDTIRQPLNPNQPEYEYESGEGWFNTNDQGLANLNFVNNPQSNPAFAPTSSSYNWNQYSILPAGTYFLAVTGYSSYFSGSPTDASSLNSYYAKYLADKANGDDDGEGGVNSTTPFGFYLLHAMTGTYQLNARITGDFNGDGVADLADLRLLRLQTAEYLPTQGIAGAGYADGSADGSAWVGLPSNTSSPLTDLQQYDLTGNSRIDQNDIAAWGRYTNQSTVVSLTWNNTAAAPGTDPYNPGGPGDGITWDLETSQNFNDTIGTDVFFNGDLVTFNDNNNGNYAVTLNTTVSPGAMTVNNSAGDYVISGTGSIAGSTSLLKTGSSKLTLSTVNTYSGGTNVSGGTLALTVTGALPVNSPLTIGAGATVVAVNHGNGPKVVLQTSSLSIAGSTNSWTGLLDLTGTNDLIAHNGSLSQITNQIKSGYASNWQGSTGITSSAAAADSTRLTALGAIQNSINGTPRRHGNLQHI